MKQKELFRNKRDCCGCELCVNVCPQHIISMKTDDEGFLYPYIEDESKCKDCKLCLNKCPVKSPPDTSNRIIYSYAGFDKEESQIIKSASGGFATALAKVFIKQGGIVFGVAYSSDWTSARYTKADSLHAAESLRTSKYIQAIKGNLYRDIKQALINKNKVLVIGLPCEIAAIKKFIKDRDNLYLVSLICHGPTSPKVHLDYLRLVSHDVGQNGISHFTVRHKINSCKPYYIKVLFSDGHEYMEEFHKSYYGIAFRFFKRPSCAYCRYKIKDWGMPSDLTIGDFHYAHEGMEAFNKWGTSQMSTHTDKGLQLVKMVSDSFNLFPITEYVSVHYNLAFFKPISTFINRPLFSYLFTNSSLEIACKHFSVRLIDGYFHVKASVKRLLARLKKHL